MRWALMRFVVFAAVRGGEAGAVGVMGRAEEMEGRLARRREALEGWLKKAAPDQRSLLMRAYGEGGGFGRWGRAAGGRCRDYQWLHRMRKLGGRVDEFLVLGRAMSEEEVRGLFEAGNPYH